MQFGVIMETSVRGRSLVEMCTFVSSKQAKAPDFQPKTRPDRKQQIYSVICYEGSLCEYKRLKLLL